MKINTAHCFFEQSGTFKNEFIKLGYKAYDYDIQNIFQQTDFVVDLFIEIDNAFNNKPSVFDFVVADDIIIAFFPCIHFCDSKTLLFKGVHISQKCWSLDKIMEKNIELSKLRQIYFELLLKLVCVAARRKLPLIVENPWNNSGQTFLQNNFVKPSIIDKNRNIRGDFFVKPTAYWFFNCFPTSGFSYQKTCIPKIVYNVKDFHPVKTGCCSAARSMISSDYARNFICDFIIGKEQSFSQAVLF